MDNTERRLVASLLEVAALTLRHVDEIGWRTMIEAFHPDDIRLVIDALAHDGYEPDHTQICAYLAGCAHDLANDLFS